MTRTAKTHTLLLLSVLVAALAGGVFATADEPRRALEAPAVPPTIDVGELAGAMRTLAEELARLREEVAAAGIPHAPSGERAPALAVTDTDRLALAVEQLVERMSPDAARSAGDPGTSGTASARLDVHADPARALESLAQLRRKPEAQRLHEHILQGPREILDRYGIPSSVYTSPEGELNFVYQRDESEPPVGFSFACGQVVRVWGQ